MAMDLENIMQDTIVIQARVREKQGRAFKFAFIFTAKGMSITFFYLLVLAKAQCVAL